MVRDFLELSGQKPFDPPSVAGFPAIYEAPLYDKFWFNPATIISRYNLGALLLNKNATKVDFKVTTFVEKNVSVLATIAGAAPMIGFLGTVIGMIVAGIVTIKDEMSAFGTFLLSNKTSM